LETVHFPISCNVPASARSVPEKPSRREEKLSLKDKSMKRNQCKVTGLVFAVGLALLVSSPVEPAQMSAPVNQVLEWNQIFIDTLIATNTANSSSQRLGAIVHTAIFDAYNGIERRYTPIFVHTKAPHGASRRATVIAAGHTALVGLFPSKSQRWMRAMRLRWRR
jgi:hypothetical protein